MKTGIELIAEERKHQIEIKGYTLNSDLEYKTDDLAMAAASYAIPEKNREYNKSTDSRVELKNPTPYIFPWSNEHWKPTPLNRVLELQKAGALIAAEIDRLNALENTNKQKVCGKRNILLEEIDDALDFIDESMSEEAMLKQMIDEWCLKQIGNTDKSMEVADKMFSKARDIFYKNI